MSDENTAAGNSAPAVATPPAASPAPAPAPAPAPKASDNNPTWLPDRLAQHERSLLKDLGFSSKEEAQAAKRAADELNASKKTQEERLNETTKQLSTVNTTLAEYEKTISARAAREMSALSPERQAAVKALAGDSAAKQLNVIDALSATWGQAPAPAAAPAAVSPPANSAPSAGGPPPPPANPQPNVLATYEALRTTNPVKAASYYLQNQAAITAARKT